MAMLSALFSTVITEICIVREPATTPGPLLVLARDPVSDSNKWAIIRCTAKTGKVGDNKIYC